MTPPCPARLLDDDDRSHGVVAVRRTPAALFHRRAPCLSARRAAAEELFHPATCEDYPT